MKTVRLNDWHTQKLGDGEIVRRILAGEKVFYEILVRRNNQTLYRVIRSYLRHEAEIEDAMQNAYLKAFSKLHQFRLESSFSTWLVRIGINEALARLKEKGKWHRMTKPEIDNTYTPLDVPDDKQPNPQERMIRSEAKYLFERAIDSLELKYRTVYTLKEIEEMSVKEISIALAISETNVKVRLHRAKEMLKDRLYEISNDRNLFEFGSARCDGITERVMSSIG